MEADAKFSKVFNFSVVLAECALHYTDSGGENGDNNDDNDNDNDDDDDDDEDDEDDEDDDDDDNDDNDNDDDDDDDDDDVTMVMEVENGFEWMLVLTKRVVGIRPDHSPNIIACLMMMMMISIIINIVIMVYQQIPTSHIPT